MVLFGLSESEIIKAIHDVNCMLGEVDESLRTHLIHEILTTNDPKCDLHAALVCSRSYTEGDTAINDVIKHHKLFFRSTEHIAKSPIKLSTGNYVFKLYTEYGTEVYLIDPIGRFDKRYHRQPNHLHMLRLKPAMPWWL